MKLTNRALAATSTEVTRTEQLHGRDYLVVPVVAIIEGVRVAGNVGEPELALIAEFNKSLDSWNGRPIVLNHPRVDDSPVSANIPTVYDEYACGLIFNASVDGKKLKMEAWIDLERAENAGGSFQETVDRINGGDIIEVSTGFCCNAIPARGRYLGTEYTAVWRDIVPDHLALLPEMIGACSVEDGCGTRLNSQNDNLPQNSILPLPITLHSHTKVASAKPLRNDTSTHADCCSGKELKCTKCVANNAPNMATNAADTEKLANAKIRLALNKFIAASSGPSDSDLRYSLGEAIEEQFPYAAVISVFDTSFIIFDWMSDQGMLELDYEKDEQGNVDVDFESAIEVRPMTQYVPVSGEMNPDTVQRANAAKPKKGNYGDVKYADPGYQSDKKPRYPIDNEEHIRAAWNYINKPKNAGKYSSSQLKEIKSRIVAAWKEHIDKAGPPSAQKNNSETENTEMPENTKPTEAAVAAAPVQAAAPVVQLPVPSEIKTLDEYIANAPEAFKPELTVLVAHGRTRVLEVQAVMGEHIAAILKNPRNTFNEAELRKMDSSAVEKLFKLAGENIPAAGTDNSPTQTREQAANDGTLKAPPVAATRANMAAGENEAIPAPRTLAEAIRENSKNGARA